MAKETFYFSHDYNARVDAKIKKLLMTFGAEGYGIFWMIIEDLYNNANALPTDYNSIAFDLRVDKKIVESIINDFDLFMIKDGFFGSKSIESRLDERAEKSRKARDNANIRWGRDANALPIVCDANAIKESKVKESKEKEKDDLFEIFWEIYPNKIAKAKCKKEFAKLSEVEKEKIAETINDFVKYKPFPTYIYPNPLTYLSGKRWEDVIPKFSTTTNQFGAKKDFGRTNQVSYT